MSSQEQSRAELGRLVNELRRARRVLIDSAQALGPGSLDTRGAGEQGWTVRRAIEYCHANERWHFTRTFNFFEPEVKLYDSPAVLADNDLPSDMQRTLARECAEVWLAGRETEMWLDIIESESLDSIRHASLGWPQGGWTIREVFRRVTAIYAEKAKDLQDMRR